MAGPPAHHAPQGLRESSRKKAVTRFRRNLPHLSDLPAFPESLGIFSTHSSCSRNISRALTCPCPTGSSGRDGMQRWDAAMGCSRSSLLAAEETSQERWCQKRNKTKTNPKPPNKSSPTN